MEEWWEKENYPEFMSFSLSLSLQNDFDSTQFEDFHYQIQVSVGFSVSQNYSDITILLFRLSPLHGNTACLLKQSEQKINNDPTQLNLLSTLICEVFASCLYLNLISH